MGCWGITALESDNGLDAVRCVRYNLPADGQLDLGEMLERLKKDRWNAPCDVKLGCAHTSPMALAEIVVKYLDGDPGSLDYDEEWAAEDNKFRSITSFTASRASLRELRDYLADTLKYARIRAERQIKAGGWFDPKDWDGWQKHMEGLIHRLDGVLALCALPGFVDSKNEEKTERNAGYLVVSHSGGGMLRQGTRKGIRRTPANRGMRAHRIVKSLDISEDVCHGLCP